MAVLASHEKPQLFKGVIVLAGMLKTDPQMASPFKVIVAMLIFFVIFWYLSCAKCFPEFIFSCKTVLVKVTCVKKFSCTLYCNV